MWTHSVDTQSGHIRASTPDLRKIEEIAFEREREREGIPVVVAVATAVSTVGLPGCVHCPT
jgi:hypothetical protein